jgi:hypothetical protein
MQPEADTRSDMTTFAALQDAERELEARTAAAWTAYSDELRDLGGDAYAIAEPAAWEGLQSALRELQVQRDELAASGCDAEGEA